MNVMVAYGIRSVNGVAPAKEHRRRRVLRDSPRMFDELAAGEAGSIADTLEAERIRHRKEFYPRASTSGKCDKTHQRADRRARDAFVDRA